MRKKYGIKIMQFMLAFLLAIQIVQIKGEIAGAPELSAQQPDRMDAAALPESLAVSSSAAIELFREKNGTPAVVSDSRYAIYVYQETGLAAVQDIRNDILYLSNPMDAEEDSLAIDKWKSNLRSQLMIEIYDKRTTMSKLVNSLQGSVRKNGVSIRSATNSITVTYDFPEEQISVPLEYHLEEDGFSAHVDLTEIAVSNKDLLLSRIHVLPFFASAGQDEEGYSMVPDGSGALIYFNNRKTTVNSLLLHVFGEDRSILKNDQLVIASPTYLPVFGMKKETGGFVAVITESEAVAQIASYVAGMVSGYNNTYASFLLRNSDVYQITDRSGSTRDIRVIDENRGDLKNLSIRYMLLDKTDSDYVAMANRYRDYLVETEGAEQTKSAYNPMYLNFYGAAEKIKPFLGFPVKGIQPLSTYRQVAEAVKELRSFGMEDVGVRYLYSTADAVKKKMPRGIARYARLGTAQEFDELNRLLGKNIFYGAEFMNIRKFGNLGGSLTGAVKSPVGAIAYQYYYNKASNRPITNGEQWFLTRPELLMQRLDAFLGNVREGKDVLSISYESIGAQLYSHFDDGTISRTGLQDRIADAFRRKDEVNAVSMFSGANSYILPFADKLADVSTSSSGYAVTDLDVPFLQIAVRGLSEVIAAPVNLSADSLGSFLKAVESGSAVSFSLICSETSLLHGTSLQWLYAADYKAWSETIRSYYEEYDALYEEIAGSRIIAHGSPAAGIVRTAYENGIVVYVNYTDKVFADEEVTVQGMSFGSSGINGNRDGA